MTVPIATRIDHPIGRDREVQSIVDVLADNGTVGVTGAAGIGKSMVMQEVILRLTEQGRTVIATSGMEATSVIPLAPLLKLCPPGSTDAGPAIITELFRRSRTQRTVVTVDDAHILDAATAAIVRQLASTDVIGLVIAVRDGERPPDAISSILDEGLSTHVPLGPLDEQSTRQLATAMLGPVEAETITWIHRHGGGNPLYTRELIIAGTRTGALQSVAGRWTATDAPVWTSRLHALVARRLADLDPDERAALQIVCIGERVPLDVLDRLGHLGEVTTLEGRDLVRVEGRDVEPGHPLFRTAMLGTMTEDDVRRTQLRLAENLAVSEDPADAMAIVGLRLDAGAAVDTADLRAAIAGARSAHLPERIERFARHLIAVEPGPDAHMELCEALATQQRWSEAHEELEQALAAADPAAHPALLEAWAYLNFEFRSNVADAAAILREIAPRVGRGSDRWAIATARIRLFTDDLDTVIADQSAWLDTLPSSPLEPFVRVNIATAASHSGAVDTGLRSGEAFDRLGAVDPVERARMDGVTMQLLAWQGGSAAVADRIDQALSFADATDSFECEFLSRIYCGMVLNDLMCPADAAPYLDWAAETERRVARRRANGILIAEKARVTASLRGGSEESRHWIDRVRQLPEEDAWLAVPLARLAESMLASRHGDDPAPAIHAGLDHARRRSARVHEVPLLRQLGQVGYPAQTVERLAELADFMGGGLAELVHREAAALSAADPTALDQVAVDAWGFGAKGVAADTAARAVALHEARGDLRSALVSQLRSDAIVGDEAVWSLARSSMTRVLTDREIEVVVAVAGGERNRSIADRLFISHRTVESHLRRVYQRFDVDGRDELTPVVRQALTPGEPPASSRTKT